MSGRRAADAVLEHLGRPVPARPPLDAVRVLPPSPAPEGAVPADAPTILATSGGYALNPEGRPTARPGATRAPRGRAVRESAAGGRGSATSARRAATSGRSRPSSTRRRGLRASTCHHLHLFSMPNVEDVEGHLLAQDVVWVGGGSVANLLAVWRVHGLDEIFRRVWEAGVVLSGVSAGSICWHAGGTTDSFGPDLRAGHGRARPAPVRQRRALRQRGAAPPAGAPAGRRRRAAADATAPTTASGSSTAAPSSSRRSASGPARGPTSSGASGDVAPSRSASSRAGCPRAERRRADEGHHGGAEVCLTGMLPVRSRRKRHNA